MATLMGVTVTLVPLLAILGILIGLGTLMLLWRSPLRSTWALIASFTVMLGVSHYYQIDRELVMGLAVLALPVVFRSVVFRRRRASLAEAEELEELDLIPDEGPDLEPATPANN